MSPGVTVFVPTWNAGPDLTLLLSRLRSQQIDVPVEILIIDSGSTDGTAEALRARSDVRLIEIDHEAFDHGAVRALAVGEARGDIVAMTVQDALPADNRWLAHLVSPFDDPSVAGVYSRQLPRPNANPFIRSRLSEWAAGGDARRVQRIADPDAFQALPPLQKLERVAFDNVASAVRRAVALDIPFRPSRFGEDLDWSYRVLQAGHSIVYEPASRVVHSHDRPLSYEIRRIYADHQQLQALLGVRTVPDLPALLRRSAGGVAKLLGVAAADPTLRFPGRLLWGIRAVPWGVGITLAQYLAARSGTALASGNRTFQRLDRTLSRGV